MTSTGPESPVQPEPSAQPVPQGAPQQWAWARPQQPMQTVETEPLEYHRLLRGVAGYRWWKPLVLLLVSGVFFGILTVVLTVALIPVLMFGDPEYAAGLADGTGEVLDTQRPVSVLLSMLSIIIMIPSVILGMLVMGMRPVGRIWSVATRIRWGLLGRLCGAAVLAVVVMNVVGIGMGIAIDPVSLTEPPPGPERDFDVNAALLSMLLVLLLVPLQATAEEVVFRGLFMQVLGSWLKNPWFAILIPSVGFALAHIYDIWGLLAVGMLGAVAAWLTWRTGGLEAAIAIHIVNNVIVFGLMASGIFGETAQTADSGGVGGVVGEAAGLALFVWLTLRIFARGGHGRERIDLIQVPVAVPVPVSVSVSDPRQSVAAEPSTAPESSTAYQQSVRPEQSVWPEPPAQPEQPATPEQPAAQVPPESRSPESNEEGPRHG